MIDHMIFTPFTISIYVASVLVGIPLLWIIARKSGPELGVYRHLLFTFVSFDIGYATADLIICPISNKYFKFANSDCQAYGIMNGVMFNTSIAIGTKWPITLFNSIHHTIFALLLFHFVYRYIVLQRQNYLFIFQSFFGISMLVAGCAAQMIAWGLVQYYMYHDYPSTTPKAIEPFFKKYPNLSSSESIIVDYWEENDTFRWIPCFATIFFASLNTLELTVICVLSVLILKIFRNKVMSAKLLRMQKQLFYTLLCQFVFPLFILYFPPIILITLPLTRLSLEIDPFLFSYGFTLFPLIDSLIIIFGIREYRLAFLKLIRSPISCLLPPTTFRSNFRIFRVRIIEPN